MKRILAICTLAAMLLLSACSPAMEESSAPVSAALESTAVSSRPVREEIQSKVSQSEAPQSEAAPTQAPESSGGVLPAAVSAQVAGVTVEISPVMELLSVVQYLSGYDELFGLITKERIEYKDTVKSRFEAFENHAAVEYFRSVMDYGFSFDSPPTACLYIEDDFSISSDYADSDFAKNRMSADMETFRDMLEQFYHDTAFGEFYEEQRPLYESILQVYTGRFPDWGMTGCLEEYYGKEMAGYHIILVPLFHPGGFGPSLQRDDGVHVYSIGGPYEAREGIPYFGRSIDISHLVLHEFGHSFIPVNEEDDPSMQQEVARSEYLMEAVREEMEADAYPQWITAYEELVLRAAVIDLQVRVRDVNPETLLKKEREKGFLYIDTVYETLAQYHENRTQYPDFDSFIPVITDALLEAWPAS